MAAGGLVVDLAAADRVLVDVGVVVVAAGAPGRGHTGEITWKSHRKPTA